MRFIGKTLSLRHKIPFNSVPSKRGPVWGYPMDIHSPEEYGDILDSAFEMADDISNGNGVSVETAIFQVMKDEGWRIKPKEQSEIAKMLK